MSDAIGGSGGGGGFDIGSLLGGLMGGGGQGVDQNGGGGGGGSDPLKAIQGMLDPLGLLGGISKMFKTGDASGIEDIGKTGANQLGKYSDSTGGLAGSDPSQGGVETDWKENKDPQKAGDGYAPEQGPGQTTGGEQNAPGSIPGDEKEQRIQSSSAATGTTIDQADLKAKQDEFNALTTVNEKFSAVFDQHFAESKDGFFGRSALEKLAYGPQGMVTSDVRTAAKYLLDHPEVMAVLERMGGRNGEVSHAAVATRALILKNELKTLSPGPTNTQNPNTNTTNQTNNTNNQTNQTNNTNQSGGNRGIQTVAPSTLPGGKPASLTEKLADMSGNLDAMQDRLSRLLDLETAAANGGEKMSDADKKELAMLPTKLQRAASRLSEMHTLVSNLMNAYHQMSMGSIGHIR